MLGHFAVLLTSSTQQPYRVVFNENKILSRGTKMKILVSICNKKRARGMEHPDVFLYEVDPDQPEPRPIPLHHPSMLDIGGLTGLARYREGFIAMTQSRSTQVLYVDRQYKVREAWTLSVADDAHSVAVQGDTILIASTGTDAIVRFDPEAGEEIVWQDNDRRRDTIHLNSVVVFDKDIYATAFGRKRIRGGKGKDRLWVSADQGFLFNVTRNTRVRYPLYHPHSAIAGRKGIIFGESHRKTVLNTRGQELQTHSGYIRGIAATEEYLLLGSSKGRKYSRSTGVILDESPDDSLGKCEVLIHGWEDEDLDTCRYRGSVSMETCGREIFDLLVLDDHAAAQG